MSGVMQLRQLSFVKTTFLQCIWKVVVIGQVDREETSNFSHVLQLGLVLSL